MDAFVATYPAPEPDDEIGQNLEFPGEVWYSGKQDKRRQQLYDVQIVSWEDGYEFAKARGGKEKAVGIAYVAMPEEQMQEDALAEYMEDQVNWEWMRFPLYCKYLHEYFERNPTEKQKDDAAKAARLQRRERQLQRPAKGASPATGASPAKAAPKAKHKPEEGTTCDRNSLVYDVKYWKDTGQRKQAKGSGKWGSVFSCQINGCTTTRLQVPGHPPCAPPGLWAVGGGGCGLWAVGWSV